MTNQIKQNIDELLKQAPDAINSYSPGHWDFMKRLEKQAKEVVDSCDVEQAIPFLANVAYLKQPHKINRDILRNILKNHKDTIKICLHNLREIDRLDYAVLDYISKIPYFGRSGGRSFASAFLRLFQPDKFGIIDWRNMAVLAGAQGFDGLVCPPFEFSKVTPAQIISEKGHLVYSQDLYIEYNDLLRQLASEYGKSVADIDLTLWVYSIERLPFPIVTSASAIFTLFEQKLRESARNKHREMIVIRANEYIDQLQTSNISAQLVRAELIAIFQFILNEFLLFSENKRNNRHNMRILRIKRTLEASIKSGDEERLLVKWKDWESRVDPSSPSFSGHTNLPGSMIIDGYVIFEDLIPIRKYFEGRYCDASF